jgi:hypothetical protein
MELQKPNEGRAKLAITMIWIALAFDIMSLVSDGFQFDLLQRMASGVDFTTEEAENNDTRQQLLAGVNLIVIIISGVTFIQWFRRAYFNLHTKVKDLRYTEGWAAGSWFVPFTNLIRPKQIMNELYERSDALLTQRSANYTQKISTSLLGWWWGLWIISGILNQISLRIGLNADTADELINSTVLGLIATAAGLPLAFVTVKVIKDYAAVEPLLFELKDEPLPGTSTTAISA